MDYEEGIRLDMINQKLDFLIEKLVEAEKATKKGEDK
jgi:hypothetical protein